MRNGVRTGRGRLRKTGTEPWRLWRAARLAIAYNYARSRGEKHSVAVREAVKFLRSMDPTRPVSESAVRRALACFQPRGSGSALLWDDSVVEGKEAARIRLMSIAPGSEPSEAFLQNLSKPLKKLTLRFGERPKYPRHNAKQ